MSYLTKQKERPFVHMANILTADTTNRAQATELDMAISQNSLTGKSPMQRFPDEDFDFRRGHDASRLSPKRHVLGPDRPSWKFFAPTPIQHDTLT